METLPIVLLHKGDSFYLKYAINSIKRSNPKSKIYLISDGVNEDFDLVHKLKMSDFNKYGKILEKIYVHRNKSNPEIELFCIKRWLVLLDFMQKMKLKKVFTMDSDVLLFEDITKDSFNYSKFDVLLASGLSAGLTIINSVDVLVEYKKIVFDFYKNKIEKVEYEPNGTITDMSFWKKLNRDKKFDIGDITFVINSAVYDAGVLVKQNEIIMVDGQKKIVFIKGMPYGLTKNGKIRLKCIHCQGPTKFYMKYYLKGSLNLFEKSLIIFMIFLRDKISPLFSKKIRFQLKQVVNKFGF